MKLPSSVTVPLLEKQVRCRAQRALEICEVKQHEVVRKVRGAQLKFLLLRRHKGVRRGTRTAEEEGSEDTKGR